jgi:hypothetical protein
LRVPIPLLALLIAVPTAGSADPPSCDALWQQRNAIYKAAGYCFKTPRALAFFGNAGCKFDDIRDVPLSDRDQQAIAQISQLEGRISCDAVPANGEIFGPIELRIELSAAASKKLVENGESIRVAAYYYGNPTRSDAGDDPRDVDFGEDQIDVQPGAPAVIPPHAFDRKLLNKVFDRIPAVNINVFSSRKVFSDNILDCDIVQGSVVELAKRAQTVTCKLIGERG